MPLITKSSGNKVDNGANNVDGNSQSLDLSGVPRTELLDNGGKEDDEGVEHSQAREESKAVSPSSPVKDGSLDIGRIELAEVVSLADLCFLDESQVLLILISEKLGGLGAVGENEGDNDAGDEGRKTVDDDDPSPRTPSTVVIHEADAVGNETTGDARHGSSREEVGNSQGQVLTAVEHGQIQDDTGEETGFANSEQETADDQASKTLNKATEGSDDTPGKGQTGKISSGLHALDDQVGWGFEKLDRISKLFRAETVSGTYTVGNEKNRDSDLEIVSFKTELFFHVEQTSVTNVD